MVKGKDKDEGGPSKNQLRGLTYTQEKPAFLRNIATALSGPSSASSSSGRPPIPTRPGDDPNKVPSDEENDFHNEDVGDEAPQVVVLKEGRHMTAEEAELAKQNAPPPLSDDVKGARRTSSLRFSSSDGPAGGKRKARIYGQTDEDVPDGGDSFGDLVKRARTDATAAAQSDISKRRGVREEAPSDKPPVTEAKKMPLTKEEKSAMKAKRKAAKKLLSFED